MVMVIKNCCLCCVAGCLFLTAQPARSQTMQPPANGEPAPGKAAETPNQNPPADDPTPLSNLELTRQLRQLQRDVERLGQNLDDTLDLVQRHMQSTRDDLSEVKIEVADQTAKQLEILKAIEDLRSSISGSGRAASDLASDGAPLRFNAIMRDQITSDNELRQELAKVVQEEMPKQGLLHVENVTTVDRVIEINRTPFTIPANQKRSFKVQVGTVTTQLLGEPMMTWTVGAPRFEQGIQIVPKSQPVTTARPLLDVPAAGAAPTSDASAWSPIVEYPVTYSWWPPY